MKALCGAVTSTEPFSVSRSILRNLIVPARSGEIVCRVRHELSLFSTRPEAAKTRSADDSDIPAFLQPVMQGDNNAATLQNPITNPLVSETA
jgi:hypothetical protein